ncbi:MAG TPA: hypothetical protein VEL80_02530 [Burkholderiales bacterium]|nr:hypothetical protein [Burkholderiales bacterium]
MRPFAAIVRHPFAVSACLLLAACGGGGGGSAPASTSFALSTNTLAFVAEAPSTTPPPAQLTGTVRGSISGTLYIRVVASGDAVSFISGVTFNSPDSGTVSVFPRNPSTLGVGSHSGTITVTACVNDPTCTTGQLPGSPQSVAVSYLVKSSVHAETVMPHVATTNQSGAAIIRGTGFTGDTVNKVAFGTIDAVSFTVVSDTEIHAIYPALAAGTYALNLANASGAVPFSGELAVVTPKTYAPGTLQYPSAPQQTLALKYDAEREALLVAASYFDGNNFNTASRTGNRILRYQFVNGAFSTLTTKDVPLLQDIALTPDGRQVIAITDTEVIHLDPVTLTEIRRTSATLDLSTYLKDIVVTNDGNALITTGYVGSGDSATYLYPLSQSQLYATNHSCTYNASPAASADGSLGVFIQDPVSPPQPLCAYEGSSGSFAVLPITGAQNTCVNSFLGTCRRPSLDASGNRIAVISGTIVSVYDRAFTLLGRLPGSNSAVAVSPDGTRAYAYDSSDSLHTFDLTAATVNGQFQEIGTGTALAGSPGPGISTQLTTLSQYAVVRLITSPDGSTLFLAGRDQLVIQPAP